MIGISAVSDFQDPDKIIEELRGESKSVIQSKHGSVTQIINKAMKNGGDENNIEELFDTVMDQLHAKAQAVINRFSSVRNITPDELVNQFYIKLMRRLAGAVIDFNNRTHFYNTAAQNFRWILLNTKSQQAGEPDEFSEELGPADSVADFVELNDEIAFLMKAIESLSENLQSIVNMYLYLDMTFQEIADDLGIAVSTAHERYNRALKELRAHMPNPETQ